MECFRYSLNAEYISIKEARLYTYEKQKKHIPYKFRIFLLLHLKTGVPILVLMPRRVSDDFNFEFILSDPIIHKPTEDKKKDIREITQKFTSEIEKTIRLYPEQWLWAHRRWLDINR
jgi:lauroyl/myristoyl acyltransferase